MLHREANVTTILSPHLDDAVLSLGQYLAAWPHQQPVQVVTVFAGQPADPTFLSDYDEATGFPSSYHAMNTRRHEDLSAMRVLGAKAVHLHLLDQQYRERDLEHLPVAERAAVRSWQVLDCVRAFIDPTRLLFAPLGIGHPDHRLLSWAAEHSGAELVLFYEELPYRVLSPEQVSERLADLEAEGWSLEPWPVPRGELALKREAISRYRSQFPNGADDDAGHCLQVPERVWRATPCRPMSQANLPTRSLATPTEATSCSPADPSPA